MCQTPHGRTWTGSVTGWVCVCLSDMMQFSGACTEYSHAHTHLPTHTPTHTTTHTHIHTHACKCIHTHMHAHAYIHVHMHAHAYKHTHTHIHTLKHTYTRTNTCTHTHTDTCTHTHTHRHTHTNTHTRKTHTHTDRASFQVKGRCNTYSDLSLCLLRCLVRPEFEGLGLSDVYWNHQDCKAYFPALYFLSLVMHIGTCFLFETTQKISVCVCVCACLCWFYTWMPSS